MSYLAQHLLEISARPGRVQYSGNGPDVTLLLARMDSRLPQQVAGIIPVARMWADKSQFQFAAPSRSDMMGMLAANDAHDSEFSRFLSSSVAVGDISRLNSALMSFSGFGIPPLPLNQATYSAARITTSDAARPLVPDWYQVGC